MLLGVPGLTTRRKDALDASPSGRRAWNHRDPSIYLVSLHFWRGA